MVYDDDLYRWYDIATEFAAASQNPFTAISHILTDLGIDAADAFNHFTLDYHDAMCFFSDYSQIYSIISMVGITNGSKYNALIASYPFTQKHTKIRAPDITHEIEASSSGSADVTRRQTETQTETPIEYGQTRTHSVAPFDTTNFKSEYQDTITNNGSRTVSTSYSGDPDHTDSESTGTRTDTESGIETTTETTIGSDRLTLADTMADMQAAATIWQIIERDIAAKLFLQVWR